MESGKEGLQRGIEKLKPGNLYYHWADAIQSHVEDTCGFHLLDGLGGHGIGRTTRRDPGLKLPPFVPNTHPKGYRPHANGRGRNPLDVACEAGVLLAVKPLIAVGTAETRRPNGQWGIHSRDGSMTAHYSHEVLITESGPMTLTEGLEDIPDVL